MSFTTADEPPPAFRPIQDLLLSLFENVTPVNVIEEEGFLMKKAD
jgi:hypothetical protein